MDFISAVTIGLDRMIPSDLCAVHVLDRQHHRLVEHMLPANPYTAEEIDYYKQHPNDNPLVEYYHRTGDPYARRVSDVIKHQDWLKSAHYRHCLKRLRLQYFLALPVQVDDTTIAALSFNRVHRNFTKADCALLDAFAPHFRLAWQRHKNPWKVNRRKTAVTDDATVTARESDILYWITEGKQNREIAMILGISLYTVQKHVANILRKLNVENRHALTVLTLNRATGR